jgi:hypothetical protein
VLLYIAGFGALALGIFVQSISSHITLLSLGRITVCSAIGILSVSSLAQQHVHDASTSIMTTDKVPVVFSIYRLAVNGK